MGLDVVGEEMVGRLGVFWKMLLLGLVKLEGGLF